MLFLSFGINLFLKIGVTLILHLSNKVIYEKILKFDNFIKKFDILFEIFYIFISIILPIFLNLILIFNNDFGFNDYGCFIKKNSIYHIIYVAIPQIIIFFIILILFLTILILWTFTKKISKIHKVQSNNIFNIFKNNSISIKLLFFLLSYLICRGPATSGSFFSFLLSNTSLFFLMFRGVHYLQGFIDAISYSINFQKFGKFKVFCFCLNKNKENNENKDIYVYENHENNEDNENNNINENNANNENREYYNEIN
jgi:hypothetical protein